MNREIAITWINKALESQPGESIFLLSEGRDHSRQIIKLFKTELKILSALDPVKASKLTINATIKDQMYWVELKRVYGSPLVGFKKTPDGKTERVVIEDPEKKRRLLLMREDGLNLEEVEGIEGELSEDEKEIFK